MKFLNILKILFINFLIIILLILLADMMYIYYKHNSFIVKNGFRLLPHSAEYFPTRDDEPGPAAVDVDENKRPIVFSGCSIAYGLYLSFDQTIGYLVSKLSHRKVYNRGQSGTCMSHVLYELTETSIYDDMDNPEYMFYIYDPVLHSSRTNSLIYLDHSQMEYIHYKLKDGKLVNDTGHPIPFITALAIFRALSHKYAVDSALSDNNKAVTIALFDEINKQIHEKYPDIKFIIILYEGNTPDVDFENPFYKDILAHIKSSDIEMISVREMLGDDPLKLEYKVDDYHPSGYVWEKVAEKLVEKYNL